MILSLNLRTEHGCPGWYPLDPEEKTKQIVFRSKTHEKVRATFGNYQHENELPKGFAVNKNALKKQPWVFSPKTLYLHASGMMMQAKNGDEFHIPIEIEHSLVCCALASDGELYAYVVVERSRDERFKYFPVLVGL